MKQIVSIILALMLPMLAYAQATLSFDEPAKSEHEALPVGDGFAKALMYGGVEDDVIHFDDIEFHVRQSFACDTVTSYKRSLDLRSAVASTEWGTKDGRLYSRRCFMSRSARAMVLRLRSWEEGGLNFRMEVDSTWAGAQVDSLSEEQFMVSGLDVKGTPYRYLVHLISCDGLYDTDPGLVVSEASEATIVIMSVSSEQMREVQRKSYRALYEEHVCDFRQRLDKLSLDVVGREDDMLRFRFERYLQESGYAVTGVHPLMEGRRYGIAEVSEMLVHSEDGQMLLLPSLPNGWEEGSVKGLSVDGGHEVDIEWVKGAFEQAVVRCGGPKCVLRSARPVVVARSGRGRPVSSHMDKVGDWYVTEVSVSTGDKLLVVAN